MSGSDDEERSDGSDSSQATPAQQHFGVTRGTGRRRDRLFADFMGQTKTDAVTAMALRQWGQKWNVGTRHSYLVTLIAELRRRNVKMQGDVKGVARAAKIALVAHKPLKAVPLTTEDVERAMHRTDDLMIATVIILMWKTAARLTSITQLRVDDVETDGETVRMTFRAGKTIISTGAYTLWARVEHERVHEWIRQRQTECRYGDMMFTKTAEQLYRPITKVIGAPFAIRSFRRGALMTLAEMDVEPADIRLISRHTADKGLYGYLDSGAASRYEQNRILHLTDQL
ncbi:MAG: hypothetical protein Q9Q40_14520 [Acidobacteriota bacterium]|nr:hypothetical protein [Acidobacteriota bacterium]